MQAGEIGPKLSGSHCFFPNRRRRTAEHEFTIEQADVLRGCQFSCSLLSLSEAPAGFGVGGGFGATEGDVAGKSDQEELER